MNYLRIYIIGFLFVTAGLSQRIYIEPDIGIYKPSNWSKLDSIVVNSDERSLNFNYDYSLRYGIKMGLAFSTDYQVYMGYKMWINTQNETRLNTIVFGITGDLFLVNSDLGIRTGIEFISGKMDNELNPINNSLWELQYKSSGVSLETGIVYRINERMKIFLGINYLIANVVLDRIVVEDDFYSLNDLNIKEREGGVSMNGVKFKVYI